jgi:hypothetical protein
MHSFITSLLSLLLSCLCVGTLESNIDQILHFYSPKQGDFIRLQLSEDPITRNAARPFLAISFGSVQACTAAIYIDGIFAYSKEVRCAPSLTTKLST